MQELLHTRWTKTRAHLLSAGEAGLRRDLVRESEVRQDDAAQAFVSWTVVNEQNILGLDVAMQDA